MNKTYVDKASSVNRSWYVIDASEAPLGRIASKIALLLMGKEKPTFTPHIDNGDFVVVINAANLVVTGNKMTEKMYYRHSQYPGNLKEATLAEVIAKDPARAITEAVKGMLPKNKLQADRLARLKVYAGSEHKHQAQGPKPVSLKKGNA